MRLPQELNSLPAMLLILSDACLSSDGGPDGLWPDLHPWQPREPTSFFQTPMRLPWRTSRADLCRPLTGPSVFLRLRGEGINYWTLVLRQAQGLGVSGPVWSCDFFTGLAGGGFSLLPKWTFCILGYYSVAGTIGRGGPRRSERLERKDDRKAQSSVCFSQPSLHSEG